MAPNGRKNGLGRLIRVRGREAWDSSGPTHQLRVLGLRGNKHIPEAYLRGDRAQRLALLAGLMDSDGHIDADGRCEFANTNLALIDGVAELVRSLGIGATVVRKALAGEGKRRLDAWLVKFTPEFVPFRLARKVARCKPARARKHHYITAVRPVPPRRTVCIEVDGPSHLFLAGRSMVPTHNSILRSAYRDWYFKKRIEEIEAVGIERDLAGLPVARLPRRYFQADATPAERALLNTWAELVSSVRRDQREGLVIPSEFDAQGNQLFSFDLLSSGGARTFDTTKIIDRRSRAMATAVLADFLFLGQQAVGSFALSSDKTALFATALGAFAASIAAVLNRRLIPLLWEVNGWDEAVLPKIVCGDLENPTLAELAQLLATLAGAGAPLFPDRDLENHIRRMAGLPLVPEEGDGLDGDPAGGTTPAEIAALHDRGLAPDGTPEAMLLAEQAVAGGEEDE